MIKVLPAIIPQSIVHLKDSMAKVLPFSSLVQVDATDGKFVSSTSWPYKGIADISFSKILNEEEGFPFWEEMDFEADLMVLEPEKKVWDWIKAGAKAVVLHIESTNNMSELLADLKEKSVPKGSPLYTEIGLALNTNTPNEAVYPFIEQIDFVQFMGIEKIGYQKQPFDEKVLGKISDLREKYPDIVIAVDGGVNLETAPLLVKAGATKLVSGSAILESEDVGHVIGLLENL